MVKALATSIYGWIDERLGVEEILDFARKKKVPLHGTPSGTTGAASAVPLPGSGGHRGAAAGLLPARPQRLRLRPADHLRGAVRVAGALAHSWSANLLIFAVLVHMFSVFFMKAYRKPREFGWLTGLALLLRPGVRLQRLSAADGRAGLLRHARGPGGAGDNPESGACDGGSGPRGPRRDASTVQRFFALHVVVLPAVFLSLLGFHLWLVQKHGNAAPPSEEAKPADKRRACRSSRTSSGRTWRCG